MTEQTNTQGDDVQLTAPNPAAQVPADLAEIVVVASQQQAEAAAAAIATEPVQEQPVAEAQVEKVRAKPGPKPGKAAALRAEREAAAAAAQPKGADLGEMVFTQVQAAAPAPAERVTLTTSENEGFSGSTPGVVLGVYFARPQEDGGGTLPAFATAASACFDLAADLPAAGVGVRAFSSANREFELAVREANGVRGLLIPPGCRVMVPTGFVFDIPLGYKINIFPRSGTALKLGLGLANDVAVIDADYVGETFVVLQNRSDMRVEVNHGDRIAQAEFNKLQPVVIQRVLQAPQAKTLRNGGFGSTGV